MSHMVTPTVNSILFSKGHIGKKGHTITKIYVFILTSTLTYQIPMVPTGHQNKHTLEF